MKTWRDVKWAYDNKSGCVVALVDDKVVTICYTPDIVDAATIGRAIAHAWNMDLAVEQSWRAYRAWRERQARGLFAVDAD